MRVLPKPLPQPFFYFIIGLLLQFFYSTVQGYVSYVFYVTGKFSTPFLFLCDNAWVDEHGGGSDAIAGAALHVCNCLWLKARMRLQVRLDLLQGLPDVVVHDVEKSE